MFSRLLMSFVLAACLLPMTADHASAADPSVAETARTRRLTTPRKSRRLLLEEIAARQAKATLQREPSRSYLNDAAGLRLKYPTAWQVREGAFGTVVSFVSPLTGTSDTIRENVNVVAQALPSDEVSLEWYTQGSIQELTAFNPALEFRTTQAMLIGGNAAYSVTYEEQTELGLLTFRQAWTIVGATAYLFTFTAEPESFHDYEPLFERMLESAKLSKIH